MALGLICLEGDACDPERARRWTDAFARVFVVDARLQGEARASWPEPRLHYAPFRQRASLGQALNRALALAYEENMTWLWLFKMNLDVDAAQLMAWSQKASHAVSLYESSSLWRKPVLGLLVSVAAARSIGGWDPELPTQLIFQDFHARLKAAGSKVEAGPEFLTNRARQGLDVFGALRSLWLRMQRRRSQRT